MKQKVLLALSGGVDSLVSAIFLQEQGFDVFGITFVNWNEKTNGVLVSPHKPDSRQAAEGARQLCGRLGIQHYIIDLSFEFESVLDYFTSSYLKGETPNPCIFCNRHFKFKHLTSFADNLGIQKIATGHYAGIGSQNQRYFLYRAADDWKDQTFMLWGLSQETLARSIFPLYSIKKEEVKKIAAANGFSEQAENRESFNLCFVPDDDYKQFLIRRNPEQFSHLSGGKILDPMGEIIGTHNGYPFYTIGQSKGFPKETAGKKYVYAVDPHRNELSISDKQKLYQTKIQADHLNFQKYKKLEGFHRFFVRIRGKDTGMTAEVFFKEGCAEVLFDQPVFAPALGQSAVFYEKEAVVCGGIISKVYYN